jgi:arylsulfatase A-like enzyme
MRGKPNVLLIVVDTLRADHLGAYGYPRPTSPFVDRLARQGVACDRLYCAAIPTQPSFTTLYTGQHPITHGIVAHGGEAQLARDAPCLPECFLQAGYTTCAVDNLWRARGWLGRGWEFYIDPSVRHPLPIGVSCEEQNARAIPWLRAHAREPFFLLVHYWDPHYPLSPPERFRSLFYQGDPTDPANLSLEEWWRHPLGVLARDTWLRRDEGPVTDADYVVALYDQEVRYVDEAVGALVAALDEAGLAEDTLVLFTADHGESMTEHGIFIAHHGLYDCTIRVPFIARWPGRLPEETRVGRMLGTPDIAPTVLEAVGLPRPAEMDGRGFWGVLSGESEPPPSRPVVSAECTWQSKWSLRTDRYKLILARRPDFYRNPMRELYDLAADPAEERDVSASQPEVAREMEHELESWIGEALARSGRTEDPVRAQSASLRAVWTEGR